MTLPVQRLRSRLARLEGGGGRSVRMLRVPLRLADDPEAVAGFIAEDRRVTGWHGRLALVAVPEPCATMAEWALRHGPGSGTA